MTSSSRSRRQAAARARAEERARRARRQRQVKWISFLALAALVTLGLTGWALSSRGGEPAPAAAGEELSQEEAVLAFYQCLRGHGLDVDDPDTDGGPVIMGGPNSDIDFEDPAVQAILGECRDATGGGPMQGNQFGENLADTDAIFNFVECMQDHGLDMPDPDPDGTLTMPEDWDPQAPEAEAAREACVEHLDGGGIRIQQPGGDGPRGTVRR